MKTGAVRYGRRKEFIESRIMMVMHDSVKRDMKWAQH